MNYFEYYKNQLSKKDYENLLKTLDRPFRKSIRVNTIKISVSEFQKLAKDKGWKLDQVPWCKEGFFIDRDDRENALGKDILHLAGLFYIQEAASMLPPETVDFKPEDKFIIDLAAAPGSKFTQISAKAKDNEVVFGNEPSGERVKSLISNIIRLGITNSCIVKKDPATLSKIMPNMFSKVMLDAPCSGDGMIRRESKMLGKWSTSRVKFQAGIQKRLIKEAFIMLKPGGELVYSTCTMSKDEDEEVVDYLLNEFPQAELLEMGIPYIDSSNKKRYLKVLPQDFDTEGFFVAKIGKTDITKENQVNKDSKKRRDEKRWKCLLKSEIRELMKVLEGDYGYVFDSEKYMLIEKNGEIWRWPLVVNKYIEKLSPIFTGICLGKNTHKGFVPNHQLAMSLGSGFDNFSKSLTEEESTNYFQGKDLLGTVEKKFYIFTYKKYPLGFSKGVDNKYKNILPRSIIVR